MVLVTSLVCVVFTVVVVSSPVVRSDEVMTEEEVTKRVAEWREELGDRLSGVDSEEQILNILSRLDVDSIRELVVEDEGSIGEIRQEIRDAWKSVRLNSRQVRTTARLLIRHFRRE